MHCDGGGGMVSVLGASRQFGSAVATRGIGARRKIDTAGLFAVGLLAAGAAAVGATLGDTERVTGMWTGMTVDSEGVARVTEVIEYDFGTQQRHGILRDIPGLREQEPVRVASATAPADVFVAGLTEVRIGDPARTITGRHRYTIDYGVDGIVNGDALAWDAVGTGWPTPVADIVIHLVTPFELESPRCVKGVAGSQLGCDLARPERGHLVVTVDRLDAHEGVTLYATLGQPVGDTPARPAAPTGADRDPGLGRILPALLAMAFALVAAFPVARLLRRAGRERLRADHAPDAMAAAAPPNSGADLRIDSAELASLAAVEYAPPPELTAPQGGVLLAETVRDHHKVAWLVEVAIAGYIEFELDPVGNPVTLVRKRRAEDGATRDVLGCAFAGRERVRLDAYDAQFARAWRLMGEELKTWRGRSGLWDRNGERRCLAARVFGALVGAAGLALAGLGGAVANRWGLAGLPIFAAGALLAGAGLAALITSWELRVRTPEGTRLWLKVEAFRRFLAAGASPERDAALPGSEPDYTAWAIALGESDRWSQITPPHGGPPIQDRRYRYTRIARPLAASAATACTPPSSSGSGGSSGGSSGGGGGVGGGGGGGGGRSW